MVNMTKEGRLVRVAADIPVDLFEAFEELQRPYAHMISRSKFIHSAIEFYIEKAKDGGIVKLPPFRQSPSRTGARGRKRAKN
jgi:hypothetical protein